MPTTSASVVCTVLNEAASLDELLASLAAQTRAPDEIVIVDGGSTDGTWERLAALRERGLPLVALRRPGANISRGRNEAVRAASGTVIAVTDAGVRLDPGWLAALLEPFERLAPPPDVVSGFFVAEPRSLFELALGATTLPNVEEIRPASFLPSSRSVAFLKQAWDHVGGYPEWLDYCEDVVFDLALKRAGRRFAWAPQALVCFRPRPTGWRFFLQYYRYARGDGKARLWTRRHAIRYATYLGAAALLWSTRAHPLTIGLLTAAGAVYCTRPARRLQSAVAGRPMIDWTRAIALVPLIRLTGDVAKMLGYPAGLIWRMRHRASVSCSPEARSATLPIAPEGTSLT
jgi:glycosyltransferase involved in cell wall biosynthesis